MDAQDLANSLFGASRMEETTLNTMSTLQGVAVADSADGYVKVKIAGESIPEDADATEPNTVVELPTTPCVKEGDTVTITAEGGALKVMTVTGNTGSGDRAKQATDDAAKVATNYIDIDENKGITVGNMTDETLGKNTYIDAEGFYVRDGETNLAKFTDTEIDLGLASDNSVVRFCQNLGRLGYSDNTGINLRTADTKIDGSSFNRSIALTLGRSRAGTQVSTSTFLQLLQDNSFCVECLERNGIISEIYTKITSSINDISLNAHSYDTGGKPTPVFPKDLTLKVTPQAVYINDATVTAETVLYTSDEGTQGNVTLSESAENFTYLEIYFGANTFGSVKVFAPDGKAVELRTDTDGTENVVVSGTTITRGLDTPAFFIQRVVGIK